MSFAYGYSFMILTIIKEDNKKDKTLHTHVTKEIEMVSL